MPQQSGGGTGTGGARERLREAINEWKRLDDLIKDADADQQLTDVPQWRSDRKDLRVRIMNIIESNPGLADNAERLGFSYQGFDADDYAGAGPTGSGSDNEYPNPDDGRGDGDGSGTGTGDGGRDGGGGGGRNIGQGQSRGNKLLGEYGKEFTLVRGPNGMYVAQYVYEINGETVRVGIKLGKDEDVLKKYGLKPSQARDLDRDKFKKLKSIGWADELAPHIRKGDKSVMKAMIRQLERQYPKSWAGAMLRDDEVMSKIIAQRMFGWDSATFEAQIKDTKWWNQTQPYQRTWLFDKSDAERKNDIRTTMPSLVNDLEDFFGMDWQNHVKGGVKQVKTWATKIASGVWGDPSRGLEYWRDRMFDRAAGIEGTPAWLDQQNEVNAFGNSVEDWSERLRQESMSYLGQMNGKPLLDRGTIMEWASGLANKTRSEGDWAKFLRQQLKNLHPYFDENVAFSQQAAPYKALYESLMGTTTDWDNKFLRSFQATDDSGKPTGQAMSLYDYELMLRDPDKNPGAYERGTRLYEENENNLAGFLNTILGVS